MTECPKGYICPRNGLQLAIPCRSQYYCPNVGMTEELPCPPGYFCKDITIAPEPCPENHYCPERSEIPIKCAGLTKSAPGSTRCSPSVVAYVLIFASVASVVLVIIIIVAVKRIRASRARNTGYERVEITKLIPEPDGPQYRGL